MFDADNVIDIRMELLNLTQGVGTTEDNFWEEQVLINEQVVTIWWAEFQVDMHVVEEQTEDTIDHWVDGRAEIHLRPDPQLPPRRLGEAPD